MRRHIQYLIGALEHTDELLDDVVVTEKQKQKFVDILRSVVLFNAELDGISKKQAEIMFEDDLEELDETAGGA